MKGFNAIEGVSTTKITGTRFLIESKKDVTAEISKFVVHAGFGLNSLNKKVYGLDDIYYKYFQDVDIK